MEERPRSYRDLRVWQRGMELVVECYRVADRLPGRERFALADQLRRAAVSVVANVAEAKGRIHAGDELRHLAFARGSLVEVETLLVVVARVGYLPAEELAQADEITDHVGRMLTRLLARRRP